MFCKIFCIVCIFTALPDGRAAQETSSSGDHSSGSAGGEELERGSPQYIYMAYLRANLMGMKNRVTSSLDASDGKGTLLATSFEAGALSGTGINENGFIAENGNTLTMDFVIRKLHDVNTIQTAELWLFPDLTRTQSQQPIDITLYATASMQSLKHPRRNLIHQVWYPQQAAIVLDVTKLTQKIARRIDNLPSNEDVNVTIRLDVFNHFVTSQATDLPANCSACEALKERTTNTPFLVIKYYTYNNSNNSASEATRETRQANPRSLTKPLNGHRRQDANRRAAPLPSEDTGCQLTDLYVNLTDVYRGFVVEPSRANIGDCVGSCQTTKSEQKTAHALVKERVRLFTGAPNLSVCCSPNEYGPLELLIYDNGYLLIVEFPDLVATSCKCR